MLLRLGAWLGALRSDVGSDRGEGPVPYVIIVAVMAAAAAAIAGAIWTAADGWITELNNVDSPR